MSDFFDGTSLKLFIRSFLPDQTLYCRVENHINRAVNQHLSFNETKVKAKSPGPLGVKTSIIEKQLDNKNYNVIFGKTHSNWHKLDKKTNSNYFEFEARVGFSCQVYVFLEITEPFINKIFKFLTPAAKKKMFNEIIKIENNGRQMKGWMIANGVDYLAQQIIPKSKGNNEEYRHNTCIIYQENASSEIRSSKAYSNCLFRLVADKNSPGQHYFKYYNMKCFCGRVKCEEPLDFKEVVGYCGNRKSKELKEIDNLYDRIISLNDNPFGDKKHSKQFMSRVFAERMGKNVSSSSLLPTEFKKK